METKVIAEKAAEERYKKMSFTRCSQAVKKRLVTVMIGALDSFEKEFKEELENPEFKDKFDKARKQILDLGNGQIRKAMAEIEEFDISFKNYKIILPIKEGTNA